MWLHIARQRATRTSRLQMSTSSLTASPMSSTMSPEVLVVDDDDDDAAFCNDYDAIECDDKQRELSPHDHDGKKAELKRPDLKGSFRCSICEKVFCHSSSLSRHRMQAHFKNYKCTLCQKDITNNERQLRSHMYQHHRVSRMYMCRCCNWAFPDKSSLQVHVEEGKAMAGRNVDVHFGLAPPPPPMAHLPFPSSKPMPGPLPMMTSILSGPAGATSTTMATCEINQRLLLGQLMAQQSLIANSWLDALPKPIPTTNPFALKQETNQVGNDCDDKAAQCSESEDKNSPLPLSSTNFVASQNRTPNADGDISTSRSLIKKSPSSPSAFHQLAVDSRPPLVVASPSTSSSSSLQSSPTATISSVSAMSALSPLACFNCAQFKARGDVAEARRDFSESRVSSLQEQLVQTQMQLEAAVRNGQLESRLLRQHNEMFQSKLLTCQQIVMRLLQLERISSSTSSPEMASLLNSLVQATIVH